MNRVQLEGDRECKNIHVAQGRAVFEGAACAIEVEAFDSNIFNSGGETCDPLVCQRTEGHAITVGVTDADANLTVGRDVNQAPFIIDQLLRT